LIRILPLLAPLLLAAGGLRAQTPAPSTAPPVLRLRQSGQAIPHPAHVALQEWDTLGLTPGQVERVRDIEDGTAALFVEWIEERGGDSLLAAALWTDAEVDEGAVRAALRRDADRRADLVMGMVRAKRQVYEVLTPAQRSLLTRLQRAAVTRVAAGGEPDLARPAPPCVMGASGGGLTLSPRAQVVFSLQHQGDSARIGALFVGRGKRGASASAKLPIRPALPESTGPTSGGSMGTWYMQHEAAANVAWVHTQRVPLGDDNVVLVDGIDLLHQPPTVVGTLRVPSTLFTGGCRDGFDLSAVLRERLERSPEVRAFLGS
jgi:Spy/CpxP family protein refolding chaperone